MQKNNNPKRIIFLLKELIFKPQPEFLKKENNPNFRINNAHFQKKTP